MWTREVEWRESRSTALQSNASAQPISTRQKASTPKQKSEAGAKCPSNTNLSRPPPLYLQYPLKFEFEPLKQIRQWPNFAAVPKFELLLCASCACFFALRLRLLDDDVSAPHQLSPRRTLWQPSYLKITNENEFPIRMKGLIDELRVEKDKNAKHKEQYRILDRNSKI